MVPSGNRTPEPIDAATSVGFNAILITLKPTEVAASIGSGVRFPEGTIYGVLINWQPHRVRAQICGKSLDDCLGLRVNDAIAV